MHLHHHHVTSWKKENSNIEGRKDYKKDKQRRKKEKNYEIMKKKQDIC